MSQERLSLLSVPWEMMGTILENRSGIDVPRLYVRTFEEIDDFLHGYGYDWSRSDDRAEIEALRVEAIDFLESELLPEIPGLAIDPAVRDEDDIRKLMLVAADPRRGPMQMWACAVLRAMHTFAHCGSYFQDTFAEQIREQIQARFEQHLDRRDGRTWLGRGPQAIPLHDFHLKGGKSRKSMAMKLLHKAEHVSADIFDWLGVRFVTEERFDALLVAAYLRVHHVVSFLHVKPGRSRNTLVDTDLIQQQTRSLEEEVRAGRLGAYERWNQLRELVRNSPYPAPAVPYPYNPYSSRAYHSIQFTSAQRIRVGDPCRAELQRISARAAARNPDLADAIHDALRCDQGADEIRFFFPFEIQILDRRSFELSRSGEASHDEYKRRQRDSVRRRVLGEILDAR